MYVPEEAKGHGWWETQMRGVRVWGQQVGSCIVGWLFCKEDKKTKSARHARMRGVPTKKKAYEGYMALLTMEKAPIWVTDHALRGTCTVSRQAGR